MAIPQLDGYKINGEFASGGMAKIYDAIQVSLNRPVAIKFLSRQLVDHSEAKELFEAESLIIAQLNHPNIVQVFDKGISPDSQPYFVMEKLVGIDLAKMLRQGELPFGKKLDIAIQLCKGLAYAHKNGVIHRDIKPSNIIIDQHANVKILDFGIAIESTPSSGGSQPSAVMGTEGYVAPEQLNDYSHATIQSDIYSVGMLFFDLFGKPATVDNKSEKRLDNQLPDELVALIKKCCDDNPARRYQSLNQVRDELLKISQGSHLGQSSLQAVAHENKDLADNFNLLDVLAKNNSKQVYLFQKKSNRQLLVIKRMYGEQGGLKQAKYLSSLKHPNIVNIFAAVKKGHSATIIYEYLSGGSLKNQLIQDMSEQNFLVQACQICSAVYFAHQNNILHCNLSPNNILFDDKQNLKLCDFGQSLESNDNPREVRAYQPPAEQSFSEQFDIYCMGAVFYHMLYGSPPSSVFKPTRKVSYRLEKLIDSMIALDPINRPTSTQQVLVELQRIANADNKKLKSNIGKGEDEPIRIRRSTHSMQAQTQTRDNFWLWVALLLSLGGNVLLITKDLMNWRW